MILKPSLNIILMYPNVTLVSTITAEKKLR